MLHTIGRDISPPTATATLGSRLRARHAKPLLEVTTNELSYLALFHACPTYQVAKLRAGVPSSKGFLADQKMYMEDPDVSRKLTPACTIRPRVLPQ